MKIEINGKVSSILAQRKTFAVWSIGPNAMVSDDVISWLLSAQKATIDNLLLDYRESSPVEKFGRSSPPA
jgi:hypothetical protein